MRVTVERVGGFAGGATVVADYDTAELPEKEAARVREAVESFSEARVRGPMGEIGADLPGYRISVSEPGGAAPDVFDIRGDPSAEGAALQDPLDVLLRGSAG
ncbi:hypothetical protein GCM10010191_81170 [Actinomadura vinacea]|uniref:Uncharacterized protein n=1 Tax=Actinomadura vinacea TaxID=115336 RepID=A0ABN3K6E0_9ACTN